MSDRSLPLCVICIGDLGIDPIGIVRPSGLARLSQRINPAWRPRTSSNFKWWVGLTQPGYTMTSFRELPINTSRDYQGAPTS